MAILRYNSMLRKALPAHVHTEVAILGAMLLDGVAIIDATAKLKAEDFSLDSHQRIYRAICRLDGEVGTAVDYLTVMEDLATEEGAGFDRRARPIWRT